MIMDKRIVYPNGGGVSVIIPSPKWQGTALELGQKCTPTGVPFLIMDAGDVPSDRTYREAWEADFSKPDGIGG